MIQFKKTSNVIPIDFGEFRLEFVANDDNMARMSELGKKLQDRTNVYLNENVDDRGTLEAIQSITKEAWDELFGVGTYDRVYDFSGNSSVYTLSYLLETIEGITDEYERQMGGNGNLKKYLDKVEG